MLAKVVLILDKRKELSTKYKKLIEQGGSKVLTAATLEQGFEYLCEFDPDLILISDSLDSSVGEICKKLRMLSCSSRPVLIVVSKSDDLKDKLAALDSGADDYLSEPIDSDEFKARINAHLRRHFENSVNEKTHLLDAKVSFRVLKRTLKEDRNWAAMLIKINDFDSYREIYGELAADKLLQTFSAIVSSTLDENDFIGELLSGEFLIITNFLKSEHIASFVTYAFDTIVEKFYTEKDFEQGYIIMHGDDNAGKRMPLVSTSIGIVSNELKKYVNVKAVIDSLIATYKLARVKPGSGYMIEHPKISAVDSVAQKAYNSRVMVVETDEALNLLLNTTGEMQGYEMESVRDFSKTFAALEEFMPALIILDAGEADSLKGLEICKEIKADENFKDIKIILSTVIHDKKLILDAGADLYLPKPYELVNMFGWVEKLIKEFNY